MPVIRQPRADERDAMHALWLRSVRATHAFLSEDDIAFYAPMVAELLASDLEFWAIYDDRDEELCGFMGLEGPETAKGKAKLEALFIDPAKSRQGLGTLLVEHAVSLKGALLLDVNEQNPGARAFYRRLGFRETGRSPLDGAGRGFPLIHMELP